MRRLQTSAALPERFCQQPALAQASLPACRAFVALALMSMPALVAADELPKELLLDCEGRMDAVLDLPQPLTRSSSFRINLRLQDGSIVDVRSGVVEGAQCVQQDGEIKCEATRLYSLPNSVIKRFSTVVLNRTTRQLTLWVESWDYQGTDASGPPTAHMRALRTGTCRDDVLF